MTGESQGTEGVEIISDRQISTDHQGIGEGERGAVDRSDGPPCKGHGPCSERIAVAGEHHPAGERRPSRVGVAAGEREGTVASLRQPGSASDTSGERRLGVDRKDTRFPDVAQIGRACEEHGPIVAAVAEGDVAVDRHVVGKRAGTRGSAAIRGHRRGGRTSQGQRTGAEGGVVRGEQRSLGEGGTAGVGVDPGERQRGGARLADAAIGDDAVKGDVRAGREFPHGPLEVDSAAEAGVGWGKRVSESHSASDGSAVGERSGRGRGEIRRGDRATTQAGGSAGERPRVASGERSVEQGRGAGIGARVIEQERSPTGLRQPGNVGGGIGHESIDNHPARLVGRPIPGAEAHADD